MAKRGNKRKHSEVSESVKNVVAQKHGPKFVKKFKKDGENEKSINVAKIQNKQTLKPVQNGKQGGNAIKKANKRNNKKPNALNTVQNSEKSVVAKPTNANKKGAITKTNTPESSIKAQESSTKVANGLSKQITKKIKRKQPVVAKSLQNGLAGKTIKKRKKIKKKPVKAAQEGAETTKKAKSETSAPVDGVLPLPHSEKAKWTNKKRVMVFCTRGIGHRDRHLMEDLKRLMPHHKSEPKMERTKTLSVINEMCEIKNCNKVLLFEGRKKRDLYLWMSSIPNGPSIKFLVENVHTMSELKLTGNSLRGSRPLISFDEEFMQKPHYKLLKEILCQIFSVPKNHPKSQPFFDHVYTFTVSDNKIWFRNFQILSEDGALAEIGPRFVLNPIKIFSGSFAGVPLWENSQYRSPALVRRQFILAQKKNAYLTKKENQLQYEATRPTKSYELNPLDIFEEEEDTE